MSAISLSPASRSVYCGKTRAAGAFYDPARAAWTVNDVADGRFEDLLGAEFEGLDALTEAFERVRDGLGAEKAT